MSEGAVSALTPVQKRNRQYVSISFYLLTVVFFCFFNRPFVILAIGVAVLVVVFLFYFLITRGNPPKDALFFGN